VDEDDLSWAVLRYEQDKVRQSISAAEMVPAYDCGQSNELHPHDKKTLAQRLAHISLHNEYEHGPPYENLEIEKVESLSDRIILTVRGLKGDLLVSEQQPELEIKQEEEWVFVSNFECHGNQLIIPLAQQTGDKHDIESIRYAWRNNPKGFFFDSLTKLPLLPFYYPIN
jgi:sialate O-acetylesterase